MNAILYAIAGAGLIIIAVGAWWLFRDTSILDECTFCRRAGKNYTARTVAGVTYFVCPRCAERHGTADARTVRYRVEWRSRLRAK